MHKPYVQQQEVTDEDTFTVNQKTGFQAQDRL